MVETANSLSSEDLALLRALLDDAFDGMFTEEDWQHCLGGTHVLVRSPDRTPVAHAAVVPRTITVGSTEYQTGYVEGVATNTRLQGAGLGTAVMAKVNNIIKGSFQLGALATGEHHFYERLGWERWAGTTFVATDDGLLRTPEEDDGIMVLRFGTTQRIDLDSSITCTARIGDDW